MAERRMDQDSDKHETPDIYGSIPPAAGDGAGQPGDCDEALRTLYTFLDGELTVERRATIQRHLDICSPCLEAFDFEAELKMVVARCCRDQVPDHLRQRIADVLSQASQLPPQHVQGG
jgi:mycothiol system anti-sigma-R factor